MPEQEINLTVNQRSERRTVPDHRVLRDFLREELGLTGTKVGCEDGMCGACSVLVDDRVIKSCLLLAVEADGRQVTTIEGLGSAGLLHPVQQAMIDHFGFQCGFCTPGFVMTMAALLAEDEAYDEESAREALVGNICRCTGYQSIIESFLAAQRRLAEETADG
jgi:aerobic carbon-monoxide dehydrogenase small subunit